MENTKKFKMGESVLIFVECFEIVRGTIDGARKYSTAFENVIYNVVTPVGTFERYPCDMFRSVDEIIAEVPNRVICCE